MPHALCFSEHTAWSGPQHSLLVCKEKASVMLRRHDNTASLLQALRHHQHYIAGKDFEGFGTRNLGFLQICSSKNTNQTPIPVGRTNQVSASNSHTRETADSRRAEHGTTCKPGTRHLYRQTDRRAPVRAHARTYILAGTSKHLVRGAKPSHLFELSNPGQLSSHLRPPRRETVRLVTRGGGLLQGLLHSCHDGARGCSGGIEPMSSHRVSNAVFFPPHTPRVVILL